jgi:hypothetical protein
LEISCVLCLYTFLSISLVFEIMMVVKDNVVYNYFESHDVAGRTNEIITSLPNVTDGDINTAHKLSSMLLNEFNYLF